MSKVLVGGLDGFYFRMIGHFREWEMLSTAGAAGTATRALGGREEV
jgi:hypothetical protein